MYDNSEAFSREHVNILKLLVQFMIWSYKQGFTSMAACVLPVNW